MTELKFMEFGLGLESYAIPLLQVREVLRVPKFTKLPQAPDYFAGLMDLRGQVLSVIDLRMKMEIESKQDDESSVVILDLDGLTIGLIVDSVNRVLALSSDDIAESPFLENSQASHYIEGIQRSDERMTLIINIKNLLSDDDLSVVQQDVKNAA